MHLTIRKPPINLPLIAATLGLLLLAMLLGAMIALGQTLLVMMAVGGICSLVLLFLPRQQIIWGMLILIFLVVGQLIYFAKIGQAHWLPYLAALVIVLRLLSDAVMASGKNHVWISQFGGTLFVFFSLALVSAAVNNINLTQFLIGMKNYALPWAFAFFVAATPWDERSLSKLSKFLLLIVIAQLPFATYQHFLVAGHGGATWDAVVGTFGGDPERGGASGAMAFFIVFGMSLAVLLKRAEQIGKPLFWAVMLCGLGTLAQAEVKFAMVFMAIAALVILRKRMLSNPLFAIAGLLGVAIAVSGMFLVYKKLYWEAGRQKTMTTEESFEYIFKNDTSNNLINFRSGEVGRVSALIIWWQENAGRQPIQFLIGHGPAASRVSGTMGKGNAAKNYGFSLTTSSASTLLWDVGLIGFTLFVTFLGGCAWRAHTLAKQNNPKTQPIYESIVVALLLALAALPYNRDTVDVPAVQFLVALLIGLLLNAGSKTQQRIQTIPQINSSFRGQISGSKRGAAL